MRNISLCLFPDTEKAMAPHSSTLAWKIPQTEEPGRLQSMGSLRVRHNWATALSLFTFMHWRRKWQPTPVFLLENPRDRGAWWAAFHGVTHSRTQLKWLNSSSFPDNSVGKESTCNTGDLGSIPGLGRSAGEGKSYPLQYSGLENSMDYTAQTQLSNFHFHFLSSNRNSCPYSEQLVCSYGMDNGSFFFFLNFT